ncbi:MAG: GNAT family N-acetyltransferase [Chitinophagaceae bacterium]
MDIDASYFKGQYVYLEHLHPEHIASLKELAKNERIWEYTKTLLINDTYDDQFEKYIACALDERYTGGQKSFVIHATETDQIIGMTRYYKLEPSQKRVSIGYTWYIPEVWGKVYNKECKLLLLQYAFETVGFQRVEFEVAHQNIRSQKAVEKIGGIKEGVLRKHGLHGDGSVRNTFVYSITDDEWPEKKQDLEQMIS